LDKTNQYEITLNVVKKVYADSFEHAEELFWEYLNELDQSEYTIDVEELD